MDGVEQHCEKNEGCRLRKLRERVRVAHQEETSRLRMLCWPTDPKTVHSASAYPIPIRRQIPASQFPGFSTDAKTWNDRVIQPAAWPAGTLRSSPAQIMEFFQNRRYTQGLAMVVSWGGMGRRSPDIYGPKDIRNQYKPEIIHKIERMLQASTESIMDTRSIAASWEMLAAARFRG